MFIFGKHFIYFANLISFQMIFVIYSDFEEEEWVLVFLKRDENKIVF